ncbi:MAG: inositol monophosphatase family protein [Promethearchaeota archaeon]
MADFSNWTKILIDAGKAAYFAIKDMMGTELAREKLSRGAGGDITARIDQIAEDTLIRQLQGLEIPFVLISEEIGMFYWTGKTRKMFSSLSSDDFPFLEENMPSNYIIVDPVDGSSNAMRGIPFSCVSLAYATGPNLSDLKVGVLIDLQNGDVYSAEEGNGAFRNSVPLHCSAINKMNQAMMATDLDSSLAYKELIIQRENIYHAVSKRRILGSCALELGFIAAGSIDLLFDVRGILRIVDIAAGLVIVREAGGFILRSNGSPLADGLFDLLPKYDLIVGCPGIKGQMLSFLRES